MLTILQHRRRPTDTAPPSTVQMVFRLEAFVSCAQRINRKKSVVAVVNACVSSSPLTFRMVHFDSDTNTCTFYFDVTAPINDTRHENKHKYLISCSEDNISSHNNQNSKTNEAQMAFLHVSSIVHPLKSAFFSHKRIVCNVHCTMYTHNTQPDTHTIAA